MFAHVASSSENHNYNQGIEIKMIKRNEKITVQIMQFSLTKLWISEWFFYTVFITRLVIVFPVLFVLALTDTWSNVGNPCQHNPDQQLYFPHPHDAAKFIQCTKDGEMYIIQCPAGKEYNPSVTQCAHPVTTTVSISPNPPTLRPSKSFKKDASM